MAMEEMETNTAEGEGEATATRGEERRGEAHIGGRETSTSTSISMATQAVEKSSKEEGHKDDSRVDFANLNRDILRLNDFPDEDLRVLVDIVQQDLVNADELLLKVVSLHNKLEPKRLMSPSSFLEPRPTLQMK